MGVIDLILDDSNAEAGEYSEKLIFINKFQEKLISKILTNSSKMSMGILERKLNECLKQFEISIRIRYSNILKIDVLSILYDNKVSDNGKYIFPYGKSFVFNNTFHNNYLLMFIDEYFENIKKCYEYLF